MLGAAVRSDMCMNGWWGVQAELAGPGWMPARGTRPTTAAVTDGKEQQPAEEVQQLENQPAVPEPETLD